MLTLPEGEFSVAPLSSRLAHRLAVRFGSAENLSAQARAFRRDGGQPFAPCGIGLDARVLRGVIEGEELVCNDGELVLLCYEPGGGGRRARWRGASVLFDLRSRPAPRAACAYVVQQCTLASP